MKPLSRRTVLRGFGGTAIALPLLDAMMPLRHANAQPGSISKTGFNGSPKRFVVVFTGCGQGADWLRNKNGPDGKLQLTAALSPMERHKDRLLFLDGVNNQAGLNDPATMDLGHGKPWETIASARPTSGTKNAGISIDQAIAREIAGTTRFKSLQLSVGTSTSFSASDTGSRLPATSDPVIAWNRLFTDLKTDQPAVNRLSIERKSVLDGVKRDYEGLIAKLGAADKLKVQAHLDGLRSFEMQQTTTAPTGKCTAPPRPAAAAGGSSGYVAAGKSQMDNVAAALICDITRVASVTWGGPGNNNQLPGTPMGLHDASHVYGAGGWPTRNQFSNLHAQYFAAFLDKLAAAQEGDRSVLDNTVFFWLTEHGAGNHNYDWMPMLVAGSGGGYFKTGRQISYPNGTTGLDYTSSLDKRGCTGPGHGELYTSFLNAMGIPATTFGAPQFCRGPLPNLTA